MMEMGFIDLLPAISRNLRESFCDAKSWSGMSLFSDEAGGRLALADHKLQSLCSAIPYLCPA
jgi:hypothetical protein